MGSLMGGWSTAVENPDKVKFERNRSLTKEDIEDYRGSHKSEGEEIVLERIVEKVQDQLKEEEKAAAAAATTTGADDWWIRSNWAFLNEPPREEMEGSASKYAAQFHVAKMATNDST